MIKFEQYIKENHPDPDWLMENKDIYDEMVRLGDNFNNQRNFQEFRNCGDKVEMISSGEFCLNCYC